MNVLKRVFLSEEEIPHHQHCYSVLLITSTTQRALVTTLAIQILKKKRGCHVSTPFLGIAMGVSCSDTETARAVATSFPLVGVTGG